MFVTGIIDKQKTKANGGDSSVASSPCTSVRMGSLLKKRITLVRRGQGCRKFLKDAGSQITDAKLLPSLSYLTPGVWEFSTISKFRDIRQPMIKVPIHNTAYDQNPGMSQDFDF